MRLIPIIALCTTILASCEKADPEPGHSSGGLEPVGTWPATKETKGGSYSVTITPTRGEIIQNEHFSLDLTVTPKSEDSDQLHVKVDADMPAHQHGMNTQPELSEKGPWQYQVDGMLFHMAGEWVIMVDVVRGGKTERASFPVQVE